MAPGRTTTDRGGSHMLNSPKVSAGPRLVGVLFALAIATVAWRAQAAFQVTKIIPVMPNSDFDYLRFDPVTGHVYVALISAVAALDPMTGKQVGTPISVMGLGQVRGVTVSDDGKFLFIGSYRARRVPR